MKQYTLRVTSRKNVEGIVTILVDIHCFDYKTGCDTSRGLPWLQGQYDKENNKWYACRLATYDFRSDRIEDAEKTLKWFRRFNVNLDKVSSRWSCELSASLDALFETFKPRYVSIDGETVPAAIAFMKIFESVNRKIVA
jgi:hypothetical protein